MEIQKPQDIDQAESVMHRAAHSNDEGVATEELDIKPSDEIQAKIPDAPKPSVLSTATPIEKLPNEVKMKILSELGLSGKVALGLATPTFYDSLKKALPTGINLASKTCEDCNIDWFGAQAHCVHSFKELGLLISDWSGFAGLEYDLPLCRFVNVEVYGKLQSYPRDGLWSSHSTWFEVGSQKCSQLLGWRRMQPGVSRLQCIAIFNYWREKCIYSSYSNNRS